jgi:hypothetical protein
VRKTPLDYFLALPLSARLTSSAVALLIPLILIGDHIHSDVLLGLSFSALFIALIWGGMASGFAIADGEYDLNEVMQRKPTRYRKERIVIRPAGPFVQVLHYRRDQRFGPETYSFNAETEDEKAHELVATLREAASERKAQPAATPEARALARALQS